MLMWKCDVCPKVGEALTSLNAHQMMPTGWRQRIGRVPSGTQFQEVRVHCCSEACAKRYDRVEAEKVGFEWIVASGNLGGSRDAPEYVAGADERPLKVRPE